MAFSVSVPVVAPEDFDHTVELALQRERATLALTGSVHAAQLAAEAAKALLKEWDVAKDKDRTFGATLEGHANPGGEAAEGAGNDTITVTVWRSGNREPSFDRKVKEGVEAELAKREAKQERAEKKEQAAKAEARAERKAEREQASSEAAPASDVVMSEGQSGYPGVHQQTVSRG